MHFCKLSSKFHIYTKWCRFVKLLCCWLRVTQLSLYFTVGTTIEIKGANQNKSFSTKMQDVSKHIRDTSLFFVSVIPGGVYLSEMIFRVKAPSLQLSHQFPTQHEPHLWQEAAFQQKSQLLHTASWRLMGLLWQRDAQDERLAGSLMVKSEPQCSACLNSRAVLQRLALTLRRFPVLLDILLKTNRDWLKEKIRCNGS